MSSLDNFARASLNQALAWIMTGRRIRQGQRQIIAESFIYSANYQCGREKLKHALQNNSLLAWGIEQGKDEYSKIPANYWMDDSKTDYFNSALEFSTCCTGFSEIYVQTDELVKLFPVPESKRFKKPIELPDDILAGCRPQVSCFTPLPVPGEYLVVDAIEKLGKELFPDEWTGQERQIYQNGYCWVGGLFPTLLAFDSPDVWLRAHAAEVELIKAYWPLFKDNSGQKYFSNLYGLLEGIHPRLKKNKPLPKYVQAFIKDLKDNWPEIRDKASALKDDFRRARKRWDRAFDELIVQVNNKARFFDFSGMNDAIPIQKDKWGTDMSGLYRGDLETGLIYPDCYAILGLSENGKWGVLVSEDVLYKPDNSGDVIEKDDMHMAIKRFHERANELKEGNPQWTQEEIWDEMKKDYPPHKGKKVWSREVYARICIGEYPAAKRRGFGPVFSS